MQLLPTQSHMHCVCCDCNSFHKVFCANGTKQQFFANTATAAHAALTRIVSIANAVAVTVIAVASCARAAVSGGTPAMAVAAGQPEGCPAEPPGQSRPPTAGGSLPQQPTQPGPVSLGTPCNDPSPAQTKDSHCTCQPDFARLLVISQQHAAVLRFPSQQPSAH